MGRLPFVSWKWVPLGSVRDESSEWDSIWPQSQCPAAPEMRVRKTTETNIGRFFFFFFFFKHPFWSDDYYVTNLRALKRELGSASPFFTSPVRVSCPLISYLWPGLPGLLIHLLCDCVRPRAKRGHVPVSFLSVSSIFPGRSMYVSGKKNHLFPRRCLSVTILLWSE